MRRTNYNNIIGKKYNKWTVIEFSHSNGHNNYFKCKCDCGIEKIVRIDNVVSGESKSCGCYRKEIEKNRDKNKSKTRKRINTIWYGMKKRCYNKECDHYKWYGEKGIKVCKEWLNSFECFYEWALNNGYSDNLTIDRIDIDKGYNPKNCRWVTLQEQAKNRSNNIYIEHNGKKFSVKELSRLCGLSKTTIRNRHKKGYSFEDIINKN